MHLIYQLFIACVELHTFSNLLYLTSNNFLCYFHPLKCEIEAYILNLKREIKQDIDTRDRKLVLPLLHLNGRKRQKGQNEHINKQLRFSHWISLTQFDCLCYFNTSTALSSPADCLCKYVFFIKCSCKPHWPDVCG